MRPQRDPVPEVWERLCKWWGLDPRASRALFQGLDTCPGLREIVLLANVVSPNVEPETLIRHLTPARLVDCIEALHVAQRLSRKEANRIEESILSRVTATGLWH